MNTLYIYSPRQIMRSDSGIDQRSCYGGTLTGSLVFATGCAIFFFGAVGGGPFFVFGSTGGFGLATLPGIW